MLETWVFIVWLTGGGGELPEVYGPFGSARECEEFGDVKIWEVRRRDGDALYQAGIQHFACRWADQPAISRRALEPRSPGFRPLS